MSFSRFSGFAENNDDICGSGPYKYRYLDKARNARNRAWTLGLCESVFFLFSRLNKRAVGFLMWSLWALFGAQCYSWWCQKGSIKKIKRFGKWTEFDSFILVTRKWVKHYRGCFLFVVRQVQLWSDNWASKVLPHFRKSSIIGPGNLFF